jgi:hypothetical protein
MMRSVTISLALGLLLCTVQGTQAGQEDPWAAYRFLMGDWVGEGSGQPGKGSGQFSFALDLQGKVLVRKHRAEVEAAQGRPASVHEDLLVVYRGNDGKRTRAIYFDSEDHVIAYTATPSEDGQTLTFVSEPSPSAPRFRLTYTKSGADTVRIKFEMAPPGKPDSFRTYVEGSARRKGPATGAVKEEK